MTLIGLKERAMIRHLLMGLAIGAASQATIPAARADALELAQPSKDGVVPNTMVEIKVDGPRRKGASDPLSGEYNFLLEVAGVTPGPGVSPVDLCNDKLKAFSGAARTAFLRKGASFVLRDAYAMARTVSPEANDTVKRETVRMPVKIVCLPLDRPRQDSPIPAPLPRPGGLTN